jgi:2-dehydropantoate 2-reductase
VSPARSYAIVGTGAVGGFYGARLADAGHDVHFLLRSDYDHVRRHGLLVESPLGDIRLTSPNAYSRPEDMPAVDVVVVALKTTANASLPTLLPPLLGPATTVVLLQNGLGNEETVAPLTGDRPLLGGLAFICSLKPGPGHIRHLDYSRVMLAQHGSTAVTPAVEAVGADLESAGIPVTLVADLAEARWRKLVWNVPFSPLSVLLDATAQELLAHPRSRSLVEGLMADVQAGAAACGHTIPDEFVADNIRDTETMTPYRSSMKIDYDAGRPLEVDAIVDAPARAARAAGTPLRRIEAVGQAVGFLDDRRRAPSPPQDTG